MASPDRQLPVSLTHLPQMGETACLPAPQDHPFARCAAPRFAVQWQHGSGGDQGGPLRRIARRTGVKQHISDLPALMDNPGAVLRATPWGGMNCTYAAFPAGTDLAPMLRGLPDDLCPCPHWGYILNGALRVRYADDREEVLRTGDLFYLPPGHTAVFEEDTAFVEFSPEREHGEVLAHVGRQAQG